jgi:general stress protein YciG
MANSKLSDAARKYLASIGAKGGKTVTAMKRAHLSKIAAKGGKTVTPKKLAHLRAMTAARVAKQKNSQRDAS